MLEKILSWTLSWHKKDPEFSQEKIKNSIALLVKGKLEVRLNVFGVDGNIVISVSP